MKKKVRCRKPTRSARNKTKEDASVATYGCVIFLRGVTHYDIVIVKFVCSKTMVAPLKSLTLAHLELLGYLLSARLSKQDRLEENEFSSNEIHPIFLPSQSKFTELLIFREHNKVCLGGVSSTLAKIRSRYWIPRSRQIVKRV
ncbi:integrase catalytic domain-containing protein [Nephila pilipes]|uniref:Integrase catalytic domain-containing protein n=1 Tax=Nephila pilipes TaxID=299642 RepID=A0A8X6QPH7_NEPPI|nr:integrase catalytic domain-containing protein [Nephila pilipes]